MEKFMLTAKMFRVLVLGGMILSSSAGRIGANAQGERQEINSFQSLLQMMANQPDYVADFVIVIDAAFMQVKMTRRLKIAKKHGKSRREFHPFEDSEKLKPGVAGSYKLFIITTPGQPAQVFNPQEKTYTEILDRSPVAPIDIDNLVKKLSKPGEAVRVENAGTANMNGHKVLKVKLTFEGGKEGMFFYFAEDLKNLFVGMDGFGSKDTSKLTVSNISLDVPDDLFDMPNGYRKVERKSFEEALVKAERSIVMKNRGN
jgi:hypothetical protein